MLIKKLKDTAFGTDYGSDFRDLLEAPCRYVSIKTNKE